MSNNGIIIVSRGNVSALRHKRQQSYLTVHVYLNHTTRKVGITWASNIYNASSITLIHHAKNICGRGTFSKNVWLKHTESPLTERLIMKNPLLYDTDSATPEWRSPQSLWFAKSLHEERNKAHHQNNGALAPKHRLNKETMTKLQEILK